MFKVYTKNFIPYTVFKIATFPYCIDHIEQPSTISIPDRSYYVHISCVSGPNVPTVYEMAVLMHLPRFP